MPDCFDVCFKFIIAFDEVERILIRSFASPTCFRCHSISDFERHLGMDKCIDIMFPSVGGMVTSSYSAENRSQAQVSTFTKRVCRR